MSLFSLLQVIARSGLRLSTNLSSIRFCYLLNPASFQTCPLAIYSILLLLKPNRLELPVDESGPAVEPETCQ